MDSSDIDALGLYVLGENGEPVKAKDFTEWGRWYGNFDNRRLALDKIGPYEVSTVFLGIDHAFPPHGPPVLWETAVISPSDEFDIVDRYSSQKEALRGHKRACEEIRNKVN